MTVIVTIKIITITTTRPETDEACAVLVLPSHNPLHESEEAPAYWDVPVYAQYQEVRAK